MVKGSREAYVRIADEWRVDRKWWEILKAAGAEIVQEEELTRLLNE
jgi:hypothetical protein